MILYCNSLSCVCICIPKTGGKIHELLDTRIIALHMYMYCIEKSVNNKNHNMCFCYVAISDDISTHADFRVNGYHGC